MKLGISKKLFILFSFFILIFYGTVFDLFIKVQDMSRISSGIVSVNNRISALSKNLLDHLMDMEVNDKKFRLLKKDLYFQGFETARIAYNRDINEILSLESPDPDLWNQIDLTYGKYALARENSMEAEIVWAGEELMTQWMNDIAAARKSNENQVEQALIQINTQSRRIVKNGVIGFGISIIAGVLGILFISRSVLIPLNKLKTGLTQVSNDNYTHLISIDSNDEFRELADTYNEMNRQLKADEEIRSDFIACLSHEIRTPLSSIRESVNMIIEELLGPVNEKQKKFLKIANAEITRITRLLNHLLDTSMLVSGTRSIQHSSLDPNGLIEEAVKGLASNARIKGVSMRSTPLEDAPMVIGEQKEIMQVLMNIIGNAVKFSPKNGQVRVGLKKETKNDFLSFRISDTGPGIPAEKKGLIFKKYYRAEEIRNHMDGVGLGLNIAKKIVQDHGGRIDVKNNKDKGCTFSFTLPVSKKVRHKEPAQ